MADLGQASSYVYSAHHAGYSFESIINRMLNVAAARYFGHDALEDTAAKAGVKAHAAAPESLSGKVRSFLRSQTTTIDDSVEALAALQSPAAIAESLQAQLGLVGFRRVDKSKWPNIAQFANHSRRQYDVVLVARAQTVSAAHAVRRSEDGNRLYGPQVVDDLGGLVVLLSAVRALRFARQLRPVRCGVVLVLGEVTAPGQAALQRLLKQSHYVLGLQASALDGSLVLSRLGEAHYQLQPKYGTQSATGESARPRAETALGLLCQKLPAIQKLSNLKAGRQVRCTRVDFRSPLGQQPDAAEVACVARFTTAAQGALVDRRMHAIAAQGASAGVKYEAVDGGRIPPLVASKASRQLYQKVEQAGRKLNLALRATSGAPASSLNTILDGATCLDGFGPRASVDTGNDQPFIWRDSLLDRAALLALTLQQLAGTRAA